MDIRVCNLMDVAEIVGIDSRVDGREEYALTSHYLKDPLKEIHLMESGGNKSYSMYEILHPGDKALVHYNGDMSGKEALLAFSLTSSLYFKNHEDIQYLLSISKKSNKRLRLLGTKLKELDKIGEVEMYNTRDNDMYFVLHRGIDNG